MPPLLLRDFLLQPLLDHSKAFARLCESIQSGARWIGVQNLQGSATAYALAGLRRRFPARPILVVTPNLEQAEQTYDDLLFFRVPEVFHFPKWETLPYDEEEPHLEILAKHLDVFSALGALRRAGADKADASERAKNSMPAPVIVTSIDALLHKVLPLGEIERRTMRLEWGARIPLERLAGRLADAGYERQSVVESRGEFSVRGGIVDVYPPNADAPLRIDFFGEEIESIREFDASTQRSTTDLGADAAIEIPPAKLREGMFDLLASGRELCTLLDALPRETLIFLDSRERFEAHAGHFAAAAQRQFTEVMNERAELPRPERLVLPINDLADAIEEFQVLSHSLLPPDPDRPKIPRFSFDTGGFGGIPTGLDAYLPMMRKQQAEDFQVVVVCDNEGQVQRFDEVLREQALSAVSVFPADEAKAAFEPRPAAEGYRDIILATGLLHAGFFIPEIRVSFVTDREVFGRYKRRHTYRRLYKGAPIAAAGDIQRGDYVVHTEKGIGRFIGMRRQEIDGRPVDLLEIEYAEGNKLLVPVENIRLVQKYSGTESAPPALDRLGSGKWLRRRHKASEDIEKMAKELLELYARREVAERVAFGPDKAAQAEFEASFLYRETPDQLAAIQQVKSDMERDRPMDRLVCGDVGYGKTEVAIRAIFKCVTEGRQAAILVPTTILALQHYNTFVERFAEYPVRVEMLSRFKSAKEQKEIVKGLGDGSVHVVVGTHRLLSKDIVFTDLGLVVIDEEQRFGVKHKERLKELRTSVDILTLTATPIPRTLHMALSGLRDLSVINTPPPDRYPIKTRIIHFEKEQIAEALLRELNRGGQVYFVHNRIHNIHEILEQIRKIVPHARIAVAHGQLSEDELEDIMLDFIDRKYDILLSTTIIENGLDIQNCNTIIINRADAFGLAQLYQLRGRVGRENRRAYAYLIVPKGQMITEQAVKRLQAIEEFTELGSGFNIALRDMEIRGVGNLLGTKQHGTIDQIGFELYCEMLEDTVRSLRGEEVVRLADVEIRWRIEATLPHDYIPVESQRIAFYKRIAAAQSIETLDDIGAELEDRYGARPMTVENLLQIARLRVTAARLGLHAVAASASGIVRLTPAPGAAPAAELAALLRDAAQSAEVRECNSVRADGPDVLVSLAPTSASAPSSEPARLVNLLRLLRALD